MSVLTVGTVFDLKPVGTGDIFTGLGFVATVAGVVWAAFTLRSTQRTTKGQFLVDLAPPFRDFFDLHVRLRRGGDWWPEGHAGPSDGDWAELEQYMGLFERMWILIEGKSLDLDVVDRLYAYRVKNIVKNGDVRTKKLEELASGWTDFISLWRALDDLRRTQDRPIVCPDHPAPLP